jgi:hypothetical protein
MKKFLILSLLFVLNACTTKYILMDENGNPVDEDYYTQANVEEKPSSVSSNSYTASERAISANDVFVVSEGEDYVTYQYKNVRVDEISPLASLYCADAEVSSSPYLREVNMYHNGFMRATFDCVSLAI